MYPRVKEDLKTRNDVKFWLDRYNSHLSEMTDLYDEIEELETQKSRMISVLSFTPKGHNGSTDDRWIKVIEKTDEIKAEIYEIYLKALDELEEITKAIDLLDDVTERAILYSRYIRNRSWNEIINADPLAYSERSYFYKHNKALDHLLEKLTQN